MAQLNAIQVLSRHVAAILNAILKTINFIFRHFILRLRFKFEPNRFINISIIGNSSFEPPSWQPSWTPFWKHYIFISRHFILRLQFKFEPTWFINGSIIDNSSFRHHLGHHLDRQFGKQLFISFGTLFYVNSLNVCHIGSQMAQL